MAGDPLTVGTEGGGGELDAIGGDCPLLEVGGGVLIGGAGTAPDPLSGAGGGGGEGRSEAGGSPDGVEDCSGEGGGNVGAGGGGEGGEEPDLDAGAGGGEALGGVVVWEGEGGGGGELDGGGGLGGELLGGGEEADELEPGGGGGGSEAGGEGEPGGGATADPLVPLSDGGEEEVGSDGAEEGVGVMFNWVEVEFEEPSVAERDMNVLSSPRISSVSLESQFLSKQIHLVHNLENSLLSRGCPEPRSHADSGRGSEHVPGSLPRPLSIPPSSSARAIERGAPRTCESYANRRPSTREMVQKLSRRDQMEPPAPCGAFNVVGRRERDRESFGKEDRRKVRDPNP